MLRHGSLFSGIGGFDLAADWMGWENVFHCEWNDFGKKVLQHYWPQAKSYEDITKTDFSIHRGGIDVLSGGFPCQPFSLAGKRKGTEDERHLWPEMLRAIREIQPTYVVGENVFGLVNWSGGLVFEQVQTDLEAEGYEVQSFILPACGVNAPHRRDRIWIVAHSQHNRDRRREQQSKSEPQKNQSIENTWSDGCRNGEHDKSVSFGNEWQLSTGSEERDIVGEALRNTSNTGLFRQEVSEIETTGIEQCDKGDALYSNSSSLTRKYLGQKRQGKLNRSDSRNGFNNFQNFPTQSPICDGDDGLSTRLDNITFPKWRNESIKAGGNAVVPQVVHQIFKAIQAYETTFYHQQH